MRATSWTFSVILLNNFFHLKNQNQLLLICFTLFNNFLNFIINLRLHLLLLIIRSKNFKEMLNFKLKQTIRTLKHF